ncbi:MAG: DUF433 domain-containing protein [Armatimonadetes bacterium]|nr:DUF433 domain-containing protein [Armatimonadota bacterium]
MPVVRPVSVRLEREVDAEVRDIARRDDRPLGRVINELLDRALRMRRFPGIVFVEGPGGVRAHLSGSGLDVWEIVALAHAYGSPEKVREALPALSEADMRLALAYGGTYPDEIEDRIRRNERPMEDLMREYPFVRKIPA